MLFNSYIFLIVFLPIILILFHLSKTNHLRIYLLISSSIIFLSYWNIRDVLILTLLVIFTFYCTKLFEDSSLFKKKIIFLICLLGNLIPLFYYKYLSFFQALTLYPFQCDCSLGGTDLLNENLPLGMFFTFQQIGYLIFSINIK